MSGSRNFTSAQALPVPHSQNPDLIPLLQHAYERYMYTLLTALDSSESKILIREWTHPRFGFKLPKLLCITSCEVSERMRHDVFLAPGLPLQAWEPSGRQRVPGAPIFARFQDAFDEPWSTFTGSRVLVTEPRYLQYRKHPHKSCGTETPMSLLRTDEFSLKQYFYRTEQDSFILGGDLSRYQVTWSQLVWDEANRRFTKDEDRIRRGDPGFNFSSFHRVMVADRFAQTSYTAIICSQTVEGVTPDGLNLIRAWTNLDSAVLPFGVYTPSTSQRSEPIPVPRDLRHLNLTGLQLRPLLLHSPATFTFNGPIRNDPISHSFSRRQRHVYQQESAAGGTARVI